MLAKCISRPAEGAIANVNRPIDGHGRHWAKLMIDMRTKWTNPIGGHHHANLALGQAETGKRLPAGPLRPFAAGTREFSLDFRSRGRKDRPAAGKATP